MFIAKLKIWLIIQLVKKLEVSKKNQRVRVLDDSDIDDVLITLRDNKVGIIGYGLK